MGITKLTLSADRELIREAKKFADAEGTSLSSMVTRFLRAVLQERWKKDQPGPITRQAIGLAHLPAHKTSREILEETLVERYESKR